MVHTMEAFLATLLPVLIDQLMINPRIDQLMHISIVGFFQVTVDSPNYLRLHNIFRKANLLLRSKKIFR